MSVITYEGPRRGTAEWFRYWERKRKDELVREITFFSDLLADANDKAEKKDAEIARLTAEVARLEACMKKAGLLCIMSRSTPEQVADHLHALRISAMHETDRLTRRADDAERERDEAWAEVARLTSSNEAHRKAEAAASNEIERLIAENQRMTEELNATREGAIRWHNERMQKYANNCGLLAVIRAAKEHAMVCADIVSTSRAEKMTGVASGGNTQSCVKEPSPASACETRTSAQPTPEQDGPTTTKAVVSDGATVYMVMAHRGGDVENHTYCVAVCSSVSSAKTSADEHEQYRGGKYSCSIHEVTVGPFSEDDPDFVEVRKATPLPGWKTALQRVLDDRERDRRAEAAERERDEARAAVSYLDDRGAIDVQDDVVWVRDGDDMHPAPPEHAAALKGACEK